MAYLIYDTEEEAKQRSRDAWTDTLGRPKKPEDVTEFLWSTHEGVDGRVAVDVGDTPLASAPSRPTNGGEPEPPPAVVLTPEDEAVMVDTLDEANWPPPSTEMP